MPLLLLWNSLGFYSEECLTLSLLLAEGETTFIKVSINALLMMTSTVL